MIRSEIENLIQFVLNRIDEFYIEEYKNTMYGFPTLRDRRGDLQICHDKIGIVNKFQHPIILNDDEQKAIAKLMRTVDLNERSFFTAMHNPDELLKMLGELK